MCDARESGGQARFVPMIGGPLCVMLSQPFLIPAHKLEKSTLLYFTLRLDARRAMLSQTVRPARLNCKSKAVFPGRQRATQTAEHFFAAVSVRLSARSLRPHFSESCLISEHPPETFARAMHAM